MTSRLESETLHQLKNQIGIAVGFVDLLLDEINDGDPRRDDLLQVQQAMQKALAILPQVQVELDQAHPSTTP